jgi:D-alanine-D-alanine ligase-like ATP-grasp enzyme
MYICILHPYYDENDPSTNLGDLINYPKNYLTNHTCEVHFIYKETYEEQLLELVKKGFDIFINLCDGTTNSDDDSPGFEVVELLEKLGVAFTGATSDFYEPPRVQMKKVCRRRSIKTPGYVFATNIEQVKEAFSLKFPLIVKHPNGYASVGITKSSRVETPEALLERANETLQTYSAALIEEFIEGREITVFVAENPANSSKPLTYTPLEFMLPEGETFLHYDLKWSTESEIYYELVEDTKLSKKLQDAARRLFIGLNGTGYARCDTRVTSEGDVYVLEINPNCGIFFSAEDPGCADYILMNDDKGIEGFIDSMLQVALKRAKAVPELVESAS